MDRGGRVTLWALSLAFLTVTLDSSALAVALPDLGRAFGGSVAALQWVSNAYVLSFAGFILSAGRFTDRFGPRTMFRNGVYLLAFSSLFCAITTDLALLVVFRFAQGLAGALLSTAAWSLLAHTFPFGPERAKAFAMMAFMGTMGLACGPLLGGVMTGTLGWQSIFVMNVVVAVALLPMLRNLDDTHEANRLSFDVPGQILSITALTALATALIELGSQGLTAVSATASAIALLAGAAFVVVERARRDPMLPLTIFENRMFATGTCIIGLWRFSLYGFLFFLGLWFRDAFGWSSAEAGLAFLPITAGPFISNALSAPAMSRYGARAVGTVGQAIAVIGAVPLIFMDTDTPFAVIAACMFLIGFGAGGGMPAINNAALTHVDRRHAGIGAAVYNSAGQSGSLIGVAVIGSYTARPIDDGLALAGLTMTIALTISVVLAHRYIGIPPNGGSEPDQAGISR